MGFVDATVVVQQVDPTLWRLREPLVYQASRDHFTVPVGFRTDFASVPRLVVWLIPRYGLYTPAAILHDFLCSEAPVSRADADGLFRRSMRELGVSRPLRWMMWAAVRAASLMRGADAGQWLTFALVAPPSFAFVAVPALVVQAFLVAFWLVELAFWLPGLVAGPRRPMPRLRLRLS